MRYPVPLGIVIDAEFPMASPSGHEQAGRRPAVIVGVPEFVGEPAYPGLILVPFTTQLLRLAHERPELYPQYPAGTAGLREPSAALVDQVRYVDIARLRRPNGAFRQFGRLSEEEYEPIRQILAGMLPR